MPDLIFHLGLTKTASTFLQAQVFHGKMHTLDRRIDREEDRRQAKAFETFFRTHSPNAWATDQGQRFFERYDTEVQSNVVISHESLYEHVPFRASGQEENLVAEPYLLSERLEAISRSAWPHGQVKALMFIRKQADWLPSIYAEVSYQLKKQSQEDFQHRVRQFIDHANQGSQVLDFGLVYDQLVAALGQDNVLMLPYEAFGEEKTWDQIRAFIGVDQLSLHDRSGKERVNVKRSSEGQGWESVNLSHLGRVRNVLARGVVRDVWEKIPALKKLAMKVATLRKLRIAVPDDLEREIVEFYRESNEACSAKIGMDLSKYGYY